VKIIAAIDESSAASAVMGVARAFADRLGVDLVALHARSDERTAAPPHVARIAARRGADLSVVTGDATATIIDAACADDVAATVIGARGETIGKLPAGHTALAVAVAAERPVVVTPPAATTTDITRVLLPLEGPTEQVADGLLTRLVDHGAQLVPLHVFMPSTVPAFWDQPHHAAPAWSSGFASRYAPPGAEQLWLRSGDIAESLLDVIRGAAIDLVALQWSQKLTGRHAPVVRAMLAQSPVPVLLLPGGGTHRS
jgi:nucleotide-binding universal stress UspA family protein